MRQIYFSIFFFLLSCDVAAQDTILRFYRPFIVSETQQPLKIKAEYGGDCWRQSQRIVREDAMQCDVDGTRYDPCFVQAFNAQQQILCIDSPRASEAIQINASAPLDTQSYKTLDMSRTLPWAVELHDGDFCLSTDSKEMFDGLPVHYQCEHGMVLIGSVQRCVAEWKILAHNARGISTAYIATAWF